MTNDADIVMRAMQFLDRQRSGPAARLGPDTFQPVENLPERGHSEQQISRMRETRLKTPEELLALGTLHPDMADTALCNTFRHLRTTIVQRLGPQNFVLAITGVTARCGTSFVARNLAAAIALERSKTALLIDCNLQRPTVERLINSCGIVFGLSDYLAGAESNVARIIHPTGIPRLRIIAAGRQREPGCEYFANPRLGILLSELRQRYPDRQIVLDLPPMEEPDARIVTGLCDHVGLVVPYGRVTRAQVMAAVSALTPQQFIGTIFSDQ